MHFMENQERYYLKQYGLSGTKCVFSYFYDLSLSFYDEMASILKDVHFGFIFILSSLIHS